MSSEPMSYMSFIQELQDSSLEGGFQNCIGGLTMLLTSNLILSCFIDLF
jgi:hypothetical protein